MVGHVEHRKHRDSVEDSVGSTLYTAEPLPPFPGLIDDLVYVCIRADPEAIRPHLPAGLTPDSKGNVIVALYRQEIAWGFLNTTAGCFAPVVNEYPAPDTQESCCFVAGVATKDMSRLFTRHFGPFRLGGAEVTIEGRHISARMWDDEAGDLARIEMTLREEPAHHMTANDRYLGIDGSGHLVSTIAGVVGQTTVCDLVSFEIPSSAPRLIQAMRPRESVYVTYTKNMVCSWGVPERIWQAESDAAPGRAALLEILDRQARAVLLVSSSGHVLHANSHASRLLASLKPGHTDPITPEGSSERNRLRAALGRACAGRLGAASMCFALPRRDEGWPIIAELAHADPALAGPGTALMLLTDPMHSEAIEDSEALQLLGLTPAEARIAVIVGSGLAPREAANRLDLKESTVRSALKLIYDKLGIGRQAELAQIVTRLGGQ